MKKIKKLSNKYFGIESIVIILIFTIIFGNIQIGGLVIKITYLLSAYIVLNYIYSLEGRFSIIISLFFLGFAGLLLAANDTAKAYWSAELSFIFLSIGVILQIIEMVAGETGETPKPLRSSKSFLQDKYLVLSIVLIILMSLYSYKVSLSFHLFEQHINEKNQLNDELRNNLSRWKKKALNRTLVQVVRGKGLLSEAGSVVDILRENSIGTIEISDRAKSSYYRVQKSSVNRKLEKSKISYVKTIIMHKAGKQNIAKKIVKLINNRYYVQKTSYLSEDSPFDIVVVLGKVIKY